MLLFLYLNNLPELARNLTLIVINKFERKVSGKKAVRAGKVFALYISKEDTNDIIKIIKPL